MYFHSMNWTIKSLLYYYVLPYYRVGQLMCLTVKGRVAVGYICTFNKTNEDMVQCPFIGAGTKGWFGR